MYRVELVAEHQTMRLDHDISPLSLQPSPRFCLREDAVFALDDTLTAAAHRSVRFSSSARLLNATKDLSIVLGADQSDLVVVATTEFRLPLPEVEVACILAGGHILVTAPIIENDTFEGAVYAFRTGHRLLLITPDTGQVLDEVVLDLPDSYLSATQHPVAPLALLNAGEGQDGSRIFAIAESDGRLSVQALAENVIAASFNPAGTQLLITPHPSFNPTLRVLSWPDRVQLSSVTAADLGQTADRFGIYGCYLNDYLILAMTAAAKLIALDKRLNLLGEVDLPLGEQRPYFFIGVSSTNFAVEVWREGAASASVWRLLPVTG